MSKTLLVDGNNLLKIGFHGVREFYHNGKHVGGIWHFLNTLRKFLEESNFDKVVVFWDSNTSTSQRRLIYPKYKLNRKSSDNELKEETGLVAKQWTMIQRAHLSNIPHGVLISVSEICLDLRAERNDRGRFRVGVGLAACDRSFVNGR